MKIIHHFGFSTLDSQRKDAFENAGIDLHIVDGGGLVHLATFDITEDDPRWRQVEKIAKTLGISSTSSTKFSEPELSNAKFLQLVPAWHHGYPQPEDGYKEVTYDLREYCTNCGTGLKQIAPFRMKKPPVWGRRSILQMNWVFDEYFVKPDVWAEIFKPFGIGCRPVVLDRTGSPIDSVVQLVITQTVDLNMGSSRYEDCSTCGTRKYFSEIRGFSPAPSATDAAMFKSSQHFGAGGHQAPKMVLVSGALYQKMKDANLKGVEFKACAQSD